MSQPEEVVMQYTFANRMQQKVENTKQMRKDHKFFTLRLE